MKKTTAQKDSFKKIVHELWDSCNDEIERKELKVYVDNDNQPKIRELNNSDISVSDVITLGGYLVLTFLHEKLHEDDDNLTKNEVASVLEGKATIESIIPDDMDEDLKAVLREVIKSARKVTKGMK